MANEVRLIDANALGIDAQQSFHDWPVIGGDIDRMINRQPTIDQESLRPQGRWVHDWNNLYGCDQCLGKETMSPKKPKRFCPNCGAKMEG